MCQFTIQTRLWCVLQLVVLLRVPSPAYAAIDTDSCWNSDQACNIQATLHQISDAPHSAGLTVDIDCQPREDELAPAAYLLRRLERTQSVVLNGCNTPLGATTYGLEFLPNCNSVVRITVERFHTDTLQPFKCAYSGKNDSSLQAEVLHYRHNEMATIGVGAFMHLPKLRELYFVGNSLRHVEQCAFDGLRMVERIHIEHEPLLVLKYGDLFESTSVAELHLLRLKGITSQIFSHLPETMREINVRHTVFDGDAVVVTNSQALRNISMVDCALKTFSLLEAPQASVLHINLSGNVLRDFRIDVVGDNSTASALETLDLSANKLEALPMEWLIAQGNLRQLLLRDNQLKVISLPQLLTALPVVTLIDLRNNKLIALQQAAAIDITNVHTRIPIDRNPWNCLWLLNFAHTYPEKFRIFQYEKFISQINVNGLACEPNETAVVEESTQHKIGSGTTLSKAQGHGIASGNGNGNHSSLPTNISTYTLIYGDPWEQKRNHRISGLVLVFILPLGIASLFVLLYLWIYCQKVFHLSYYRSIPWMHPGASARMRSAERFDVVRQLPPTTTVSAATTALANNNEDYETPLSGLTSICNCNTPYANEKCHKSHHITYESLPSEQPYKIYEEIIGDDDEYDVLETNFNTVANLCGTQPLYDHLTYAEPIDGRSSK